MALQVSVDIMASANDKGTWNTAIERIQTYFGNIVNNASEPKFRRIKKANKIFEKDVSKCIGSEELLKAVGWADEGEFWVLPPDAPVEPLQVCTRCASHRRLSLVLSDALWRRGAWDEG